MAAGGAFQPCDRCAALLVVDDPLANVLQPARVVCPGLQPSHGPHRLGPDLPFGRASQQLPFLLDALARDSSVRGDLRSAWKRSSRVVRNAPASSSCSIIAVSSKNSRLTPVPTRQPESRQEGLSQPLLLGQTHRWLQNVDRLARLRQRLGRHGQRNQVGAHPRRAARCWLQLLHPRICGPDLAVVAQGDLSRNSVLPGKHEAAAKPAIEIRSGRRHTATRSSAEVVSWIGSSVQSLVPESFYGLQRRADVEPRSAVVHDADTEGESVSKECR